MKKISEIITDHNYWLSFFEFKKAGKHLSNTEENDLKCYIENKEYLNIAEKFSNTLPFSYPKIKILNKQHSQKKRTVFIYSREENYFLKFIAYFLFRYDYVFSDNLCSFRRDINAKTALRKIISSPQIDKKYSYKADISDYFNSVDISLLLPKLKDVLSDDEKLYSFIKELLENPYAEKDAEIVTPKKGIMAGVPVSSFLANIYLKELDEWFYERGITYARYSDDIIVFANSEEELAKYKQHIKDYLLKNNLTINHSKEIHTHPGEMWEFLGFSYCNKIVDISKIALYKMKKKMKRKARALYRWKQKKNVSSERAVRAFIRHFNIKFYDNADNDEFTWTRWYFPSINTDKSLHILDSYMQDCIRYIASGNYSKSRFNFRYEDMKKLGYISLVNAYYKKQKDSI